MALRQTVSYHRAHGRHRSSSSEPRSEGIDEVDAEINRLDRTMSVYRDKRMARLKDLDFFILDNSIRESTVGQLRSHTLENKLAIFREVKKCGMKHIVVAAFSHMTRVDDDFCQHLKDHNEDMTNLWSFSEVTEGMKDGRYDTDRIPISCFKNKLYGLRNTIFEVDLTNPDCAWDDKWTVDDELQLLRKRFKWLRKEVSRDAKIMVNFRDFSSCMAKAPRRLLELVRGLATLPNYERIFALIYEDLGESLPEELAHWTSSIRRIMDRSDWKDGNLLVHVHQQWDLQTASVLLSLENGATGVWASVCDEGAAVGHASSTITAMNLVRLGNKKILQNYNCVAMREAAREVTRITTGGDPAPRQVLYGERALDMVFGFPVQVVRDFDMSTFFGTKAVKRITTLASAEMICDKLEEEFGPHKQFTLSIGQEMKEMILSDLREGRKEEYTSKVGLALLFDRAGGKLTETMRDIIAKVEISNPTHKRMVEEIRKVWDEWDRNDAVQGDERLQFDSFYHGFMAPYFGCYRCQTTRQALQALDMDSDGYVEWKEFLVYVKWALNEYPDVEKADDLLDITFQKGLIPAMRDEQIKMRDEDVINGSSNNADLV